MTWDAFHHRGAVLRDVVDEADRRRDGALPAELPGVSETFGDESALVAALQLRWSTRLAGHVERALMDQPDELEPAVVGAWCAAADELAGVREVLDAQRESPASPQIAEALRQAHRKDSAWMAAMAGLAGPSDPSAVRIGERLEATARAAHHPRRLPERLAEPPGGPTSGPSLVQRIKARLPAA